MNRFFTLLIIFLIGLNYANARSYFGAGVNSIRPLAQFSDENQSAFGLSIHYESRRYCRLWYGIRFDLFEPDEAEPNIPHVTSVANFAPQIRYNLLPCDGYRDTWMPYLQLNFDISSIGHTDESSRLGLGGSAGAGVSYGFNMLKTCWILDLNAKYCAPNFIYKDDGRYDIQYLNVGLTLGLAL